eukprot:scaffold519517_cov32-Prasinocladus_malaysianus.AAC.1
MTNLGIVGCSFFPLPPHLLGHSVTQRAQPTNRTKWIYFANRPAYCALLSALRSHSWALGGRLRLALGLRTLKAPCAALREKPRRSTRPVSWQRAVKPCRPSWSLRGVASSSRLGTHLPCRQNDSNTTWIAASSSTKRQPNVEKLALDCRAKGSMAKNNRRCSDFLDTPNF